MTQKQALTILKTGANVFLTGEPGSGKTHVTRTFISYLRDHGIEPAITASTGIAATHIHGMTIHAWSGLGIKNSLDAYDLDALSTKEYLVRRINNAKVLIIDEVSMLSAQTLSMVDVVCRTLRGHPEPFGGLQVILVGDFFQLPPISKLGSPAHFAYQSPSWKNLKLITCYLTEQHRQEDQSLLSLLSAIRSNSVEDFHHEELQSRTQNKKESLDDTTQLFTKNIAVDALNEERLASLSQKQELFLMDTKGSKSLVEGLKKGCLSPEELKLKVGAIVMCTKNNPQVGFANGTLGTVVSFEAGTRYPIIELRDGRKISIPHMEWVVEEDGKVKARLSQIPLRLAWAITVHKSQGMSLDAAKMDLSDVFEYGQGYVALSRVRTFSGISLSGYNKRALEVHPEVLLMDRNFRDNSLQAEGSFEALDTKDLEVMHSNMIKAFGGNLVKGKKVVKLTTVEKTLALIKEGCSLEEIVKARGLTLGTVVDHLVSLQATNKLSYDQVYGLCDSHILNGLPEIIKAFDKKGSDKLSPAWKALGQRYSFDELKLAKVLLLLS
ncbi:MAG: AAA family ATPase [Candidatus Pacebacteria bacterium]|nr:AAA family ATPase [Candidatus Paceibacterota bacterium]